MTDSVIQPSFAAGELSPTLYARVDLAKYHVGLATCRNFFVDYRGGVSTRTGTAFIARAKNDGLPVRLIPFQFSSVQELVLVFSDHNMRIATDGGLVLNAPVAISAITQATPGTFSAPGHPFVNGQWLQLSSIGGIPAIDGLIGVVSNVVAGVSFQLVDSLTGNVVSTISYPAYTDGGFAASVFEIASPYAAADLALLKFTQTADVMTFTHPSYSAYDLTRFSNTNWTFVAVNIGSTITQPTNVVCVPSGPGTASYAYVVTAVNAAGDESIASGRFNVTSAVDISATAGSIHMTWDAISGAVSYNVYKAVPAANTLPVGTPLPAGVSYGYIGFSITNEFIDGNIVADFTVTPPTHQNPLAGNNPSLSVYFQQRKLYFASNAAPQTFWASKTGQYYNFDKSNPIQPNDSITGTLVSRQINAIKSAVPMPGGLVLLTAGGAWQLSGGGSNAPITPATATATPQAYNGASDLQPIVINYDLIYVQSRGAIVRDLAYNFYTNIYTGTDISILSNHLFHGFTIPEWTYAEEPFKLIWAIRSDGILLSCTYIKEQELIGWARHDTLGLFKSIVSVQEGQENFVYVVVQREIGWQSVQYIERFASRLMPYGVEDAWCLDAAITNTLNFGTTTIRMDGVEGNVTVSSDTPIFSGASVGLGFRVGGGVGTITQYIDGQTVIVNFYRAITSILPNSSPVVPLPAGPGEWSATAKFSTFVGLGHLEGQTVSILGDGNVFPDQVVTGGQVTLNQPVSKVIVGLKYQGQGQTLDLDTGEPTIQGKRKKIAAMTTKVDQTRGLKFGSTFDTLKEFKMRRRQPMGAPIELETGSQRINMDLNWTVEGRVCFQQDYPLPATVLGVIPEIVVGDDGK